MSHSLMDIIGQILGFAILALSPTIYKEFKAFLKNSRDYLSKNIKIRDQINEVVKEIRIHTECNRCVLVEFSNTEKSTSGLPFEFMNITYECCDKNTLSIKNSIQKRNISNMVPWLKEIADDTNRFFIFQNDDPVLDEQIRFQMQEMGLSTIIFYKITDQIKRGLIALHYTMPYMGDWTPSQVARPHDDSLYMKFQTNRIFQLMKQLKK